MDINLNTLGQNELAQRMADRGFSRAGNPAGAPADFAAMLDNAASVQQREGTARIDKTDKLYEQCEALETFVLKTLINGMRKTVEKSELINTGFAGEMYEDMLYDEYTKSFSQNANFGLAELAYLELTGQRKSRERAGN